MGTEDHRPRRFRAWNAARTTRHKIPNVVRISEHHFDPARWRAQVRRASTGDRVSKRGRAGRPSTKPLIGLNGQEIKTLPDVLGQSRKRKACIMCNKLPQRSGGCGGEACHDTFLAECAAEAKKRIEVRQTGDMGYGVFVRPGRVIGAGQKLDEYLGEVAPTADGSYCFQLYAGTAQAIDSAEYGNWTRFVNSHCAPNVHSRSCTIGNRVAVVFTAARDLVAGEQLFINYGKSYFDNHINADGTLGMLCQCDWYPEPHQSVVAPIPLRRQAARRDHHPSYTS